MKNQLDSALRYLVNRISGQPSPRHKIGIARNQVKHAEVLMEHGYISKVNPKNPSIILHKQRKFYLTEQGLDFVNSAKILNKI